MDLAYKTNLRAGAPAVHSSAHVMAGTQNEKEERDVCQAELYFLYFGEREREGGGVLALECVDT